MIPHWICGVVIRSVITENGSGGSSPGCISTADQSIVVPSRRGGVPVLSRPRVNPARSKEARKAHRRRLADPAGGPVLLAEMDQTAEKGAGGDDDGPCPKLAAVRQAQAGTRPSTTISSSASPSMTERPSVSRIAACIAAA